MSALIVKQAYIPSMLEDLINKQYKMIDLAEAQGITDNEEILNNTEIMITNGEAKVGKDLIDKYNNLKLIADFGVGYDGIDVNYAVKKGIKVTHTPGVLTDDVADLGVGLLIALSRKFLKQISLLNTENGKSWEWDLFLGRIKFQEAGSALSVWEESAAQLPNVYPLLT